MKRILLASALAIALPASSAPVLDSSSVIDVLTSKVHTLEYRTAQLESAFTEQSIELAALRRELSQKLKH